MAKEKFAAHRVLERVGYGVGVRLQLSASQISDRRHALDVDDEKAGIVTVTDPIEFRAGEEISIAHKLTRHEETALEPLERDAKTSGDTKPKSAIGEDGGTETDEADGADAGGN